ncbi:MAG: 4Fe-4S binding protein [Gammaproteobacteria bacterium]|nr:4Fe-4S binding protein [Gammaproteobacteria bacterium]
MALVDPKTAPGAATFPTEASWSDASKDLLCLTTGSWRTEKPIVVVEKCTYCGQCYLFCPTQCITPGETYFPIDLTYCKGCGICAKECPTQAIVMVADGDEADGSPADQT